jgi:hypothetical protein
VNHRALVRHDALAEVTVDMVARLSIKENPV